MNTWVGCRYLGHLLLHSSSLDLKQRCTVVQLLHFDICIEAATHDHCQQAMEAQSSGRGIGPVQ